MAGGLAGFGVIVVAVAASRNVWVTVPLYVGAGVCNAVYQLPMRTWLQTLVPPAMRGRVFAARAMGLGSAAALASLAAGWTVTRFGLPVTLSLLAAFALAAGGLAAWGLPHQPLSRQVCIGANSDVSFSFKRNGQPHAIRRRATRRTGTIRKTARVVSGIRATEFAPRTGLQP